jgi:hypothetical protein
LPVLKTQGVHARFILLSVFAVSLLAGLALSSMVTVGVRSKRAAIVSVLSIVIGVAVWIDLRANTAPWFTHYRNRLVDTPAVAEAPRAIAPPGRPIDVQPKSTRRFRVELGQGPAATVTFPELGGETESARWTVEGGAVIRAGVRPLTIDIPENVTAFDLRVTPHVFFWGVGFSLMGFLGWLAAVVIWRRLRRGRAATATSQ